MYYVYLEIERLFRSLLKKDSQSGHKIGNRNLLPLDAFIYYKITIKMTIFHLNLGSGMIIYFPLK